MLDGWVVSILFLRLRVISSLPGAKEGSDRISYRFHVNRSRDVVPGFVPSSDLFDWATIWIISCKYWVLVKASCAGRRASPYFHRLMSSLFLANGLAPSGSGFHPNFL
ncbi:unnamed protein product, partial [Hapterophycus canaliculatus]